MMTSRRRFITATAASSLALLADSQASHFSSRAIAASSSPSDALQSAALESNETLVTILHTNDTHSQIDPLPANDRNAGKGGVARRASLIARIRKENPNTLLLDAGDAFQGTPYFNLYKGEVEFRAMSLLGYDVMTLGNHDFDNGVEGLARMMPFAKFDFVSANYDVRGTAIAPRVRPFVVRELAGVRVGIFGLGIKLDNLLAPKQFSGVRYQDPAGVASEIVKTLRGGERCALVICLSHLGFYPQPKRGEFGDTQLAAAVDGIDLIISAHTHTFMDAPAVIGRPGGGESAIFQVGKSGINLGRVDFRVRGNEVMSWHGSRLAVEPAFGIFNS